jgi:hypothetical protein
MTKFIRFLAAPTCGPASKPGCESGVRFLRNVFLLPEPALTWLRNNARQDVGLSAISLAFAPYGVMTRNFGLLRAKGRAAAITEE